MVEADRSDPLFADVSAPQLAAFEADSIDLLFADIAAPQLAAVDAEQVEGGIGPFGIAALIALGAGLGALAAWAGYNLMPR